jgi:cell division protein FtsZ
MVADEEEDEPLFGEALFEDRRPQKSGGFLSLFGSRPRYEAPTAPAPRAPVRGSALPVESAAPQGQAETQEDLEIPSFLRRLAN